MVIGGEDSALLDSCEMFDKETSEWTALPSMSTKRCLDPGVVVQEVAGRHRVYVFGGYEGEGDLDSCEYLDVGDDKWTLVEARMSTPRSGTAAVLLDHNTAVVCGGDEKKRLSSCESFDLVCHTFSPFPDMSESRCCHAAVLYNHSIVVIGGQDQGWNYLASCEQFDRAENKWVSFPSLN